ncbi:hypothetical protein [Thalassotalea crassostreae]|nr:hypothetical protein [Thalassotalea crassostreae]
MKINSNENKQQQIKTTQAIQMYSPAMHKAIVTMTNSEYPHN